MFEVVTTETPFTHKFDLILAGNHMTQDQLMFDALTCGAKSLCICGYNSKDVPISAYLDMHGVDNSTPWVKLASTAEAGDTTMTLSIVTLTEGICLPLLPCLTTHSPSTIRLR